MMDNNLLAEIQNEVSIIGFDKLKKIHFGVESSSGSDSDGNDALDEQYYRNQPPACNYEFIKNHVVKVSQKPHNPQNRKPYNRTKVYKRREDPHHEWNSQSSGVNAAQRHQNVSSGHYAQPTSVKNYGSSNISSNDQFRHWRSDSSMRQKILESANGGAPSRMPLTQTQVNNWKDTTNFASPVPSNSRVLPDGAKENTLQSSTAAPSSKTSNASSNAVRPDSLNHGKLSDSFEGSVPLKLRPTWQTTAQSNKGHNITGNFSRTAQSGSGVLPEIRYAQNSYSHTHQENMVNMRSSVPARPLDTQISSPGVILHQQILAVDQLHSSYRQSNMGSSNVIESTLNNQKQHNPERCPPNSGSNRDAAINKRFSDDFSDSFHDQKKQKVVRKKTFDTPSDTVDVKKLTGDITHDKTTKVAREYRKVSSASPARAHNKAENPFSSKTGLAPSTSIATADESQIVNHFAVRQNIERRPSNSGINHDAAINKRFSDDFSDQKKQKVVRKETFDTTSDTADVKKLAGDITHDKTTKVATEYRKMSSASPVRAHNKAEYPFRSKTGLAPSTSIATADESQIVNHFAVRQVSQNINEVRSNTHKGPCMEQPSQTPTPEAFLKYIESRFACGTKTGSSPWASSEPRSIVKVLNQSVENTSTHGFTEIEGASRYKNEAKKAAQVGIVSWFCRIFCCARDTPPETY